MKAIEFIAPVEAMRGNLSGKQELLYPANDNKAYDAPTDERAYARNYQPRFIGAKRASNGLTYFSVKTKSAVRMTKASRHAMAILGGFGAIFGAIQRDETYYAAVVRAFQIATRAGEEWKSVRAFAEAKVRVMLETKADHIDFGTAGGVFQNPWVSTGGPYAPLNIPETILVKFWSELADAPINFKVGTLTGIAHGEDTFNAVVHSNYNTLNLSISGATGETDFVKLGNQYVVRETEVEGAIVKQQVLGENEIDPEVQYLLSDTPGVTE